MKGQENCNIDHQEDPLNSSMDKNNHVVDNNGTQFTAHKLDITSYVISANNRDVQVPGGDIYPLKSSSNNTSGIVDVKSKNTLGGSLLGTSELLPDEDDNKKNNHAVAKFALLYVEFFLKIRKKIV